MTMSEFKAHQIVAGERVKALIEAKGVAYLMGAPRVGKTRSIFWAINHLPVERVLFLTKKNAIPGIEAEAHVCTRQVTVTNYEQAAKLTDSFDLVVVDEAHNIGRVGKPSQRFKAIRQLCWNKPLILSSGTPHVETPLALYYQFALSKRSPLPYRTFYDFFRAWGIPKTIWLHGRRVEQYKLAHPGLLDHVEPYFVRVTHQDAGITMRAVDKLHYFTPGTLDMIETIKRDMVLGDYAFESDMAVRTAIHQLEAGAFLYNGEIVHVDDTAMADYIREHFGDSPDVAVMAHFRSTREKLAKHLPKVHLYSSDGHAEGVRLDHYKHFVIANTGYSGAKFVQRRERATLMGLTEDRVIHHLMAEGQLSEMVYEAVSRKRDFNIEAFRRQCLNRRSSAGY
jgi:hypothetical protein